MFYRNGKPDDQPKRWRMFKYRWRMRFGDMFRFPREMIGFITKLAAYIPILWKDRDWDYGFFLTLMRFKLDRMATTIEDNNLIVSNHRVAKQIRYATFLIDRVQEDSYTKDAFQKHEEYWGPIIMDFVDLPPDDPHYKTCVAMESYTLKSKQENRMEEEDEARSAIYAKARETKQKDYDRLFRHMRKYIERWWD